MAGDFFRRDDNWFVTVNEHDKDIELGPFATREQAGEAYIAKIDELYPLPPPPKVDPQKHDSLSAGDLTSSPIKMS